MRSRTLQVQALTHDDERLCLRVMQAAVVVFAALYTVYFVWFDSWSSTWRLLWACGFGVVSEVYARKTKQYRRAHEGLSVVLFTSFAIATLMQSGVYSPALPWTVALTAIALLTGSLAVGLSLGAVLVGLLIALWLHGPSSWFAVSQMVGPPDLQMLVSWLSASALLVPYVALVQIRLRDNHRRLHEQTLRLQDLNDAKTRFLSNVSHEIRTPLSGVVSTASMLVQGGLEPAQAQRLLQAQETSAAALMRLVNSLLEFSRLESGSVTLEKGAVDVHEVLEDVTSMFAAPAGLKGLELTSSWDATAPQIFKGDRQALTQVLSNLVSNGVKFTASGGVHVSYGWAGGDRTHVRLQVRDSGIGIDPGKQHVLFSAYRHVDCAIAQAYGGAGLGLVICRELVALMGGSITVSSAPKHGSTFVVDLPVSAAEPARAPVVLSRQGVMLLSVSSRLQEHLGCRLGELGRSLTTVTHWSVAQEAWRQSSALAVLVDCDAGPIPTAEEVAQGTLPLASLAVLLRPGSSPPEHLRQATVLAKPVSIPDLRQWLKAASAARVNTALQAPVQRDVGTAPAPIPAPLRPPETVKPRQTGTCVLLAEDNPINQVVTRAALEHAGMTVVVASDGEEAVHLFEQHRPNLVLMDLRMPNLSGIEATRAIRRMESARGWPTAPVIASSANLATSEWPSCEAAGMSGYLGKPYTNEQLLTLVRKHLQTLTERLN